MFIVRKLIVQVNNSFIFCAKSRVDLLPKSLSSADKSVGTAKLTGSFLMVSILNTQMWESKQRKQMARWGGNSESLNLIHGQGRVTSRSRPCQTCLTDATLYGAQQKHHIDPEVSDCRSSFRKYEPYFSKKQTNFIYCHRSTSSTNKIAVWATQFKKKRKTTSRYKRQSQLKTM